jgi:hypothetical protein
VIELGWTRDQVLDQIDAAFLDDLYRAWAECPPLRRLFAAWLGHRPPSKPSKNYNELLGMFPSGRIM